jgi:glycerophosphoryl diester phosphodiesterase
VPRPIIALLLAAALAALGCAHPPAPAPYPRPFRVIAHRGASAYAPENTLPAFFRALELGAHEVELDVQLSSDDALVLYHDKTLEGKTGLPGRVRDLTLAELREIEIGSWFDATHPEVSARYAGTRLIALEDVFRTFGSAFYYHVEIKAPEPRLPELVLQEIEAFGLTDRVTITSFEREQLERVRALDSDVPITWLLRGDAPGDIDAAARAGFDGVAVEAGKLTPALVARARELGLEIRAHRVRDDADMDHAIRVGSNGMTTDWPDRLVRRVLEDMASGGPPPR